MFLTRRRKITMFSCPGRRVADLPSFPAIVTDVDAEIGLGDEGNEQQLGSLLEVRRATEVIEPPWVKCRAHLVF